MDFSRCALALKRTHALEPLQWNEYPVTQRTFRSPQRNSSLSLTVFPTDVLTSIFQQQSLSSSYLLFERPFFPSSLSFVMFNGALDFSGNLFCIAHYLSDSCFYGKFYYLCIYLSFYCVIIHFFKRGAQNFQGLRKNIYEKSTTSAPKNTQSISKFVWWFHTKGGLSNELLPVKIRLAEVILMTARDGTGRDGTGEVIVNGCNDKTWSFRNWYTIGRCIPVYRKLLRRVACSMIIQLLIWLYGLNCLILNLFTNCSKDSPNFCFT